MVWDEGLLAKWGRLTSQVVMWFILPRGYQPWFWQSLLVNVVILAFLEHRPHNVPFVPIGAGLLWFGWFWI